MAGEQKKPLALPEGPQGSGPLVNAYNNLASARKRMDTIQDILGNLVNKGDTVTEEDVIAGAGKIVASGVAPEGMAALLADMPEKPEQIAMWLQQHKKEIDEKEVQLNSTMDDVRHQMGVDAMRKLMGAGALEAQASPPSQGPSVEEGNMLNG